MFLTCARAAVALSRQRRLPPFSPSRRLFDNLDETDILDIVEHWDPADIARRRIRAAETKGGSSSSSSTAASAPPTPPPSSPGGAPLFVDGSGTGPESLALRLVSVAREYSLNKMRDGPFARLAKENDILWSSGGRPDDVTVVVARVSAEAPSAATASTRPASERPFTLTVGPAMKPLVPRNAAELA
jgi:hypothetical protein